VASESGATSIPAKDSEDQVSSEVLMSKIPVCEFCDDVAAYACRCPKFRNSWANVCERHFEIHGPGRLGTGDGQRLVLRGSS
jgi:hypothetical protein